MAKKPTAQPSETRDDLTVILDGKNPIRASLRGGQIECPADAALRHYLAGALVAFAHNLEALPRKGAC